MGKIFLAFLVSLILVSCAQGGVDEKEIVIDDKSTVIDVRTEKEYNRGHLKNAINIPYTEIKEKIGKHVKDKEEKIIVYCHSGVRSRIAEKILKEMGYKHVVNAGAYERLKEKEKAQEKQKE